MSRRLAEHPRLGWRFGRKEGESEGAIHVLVDSDWAGCPGTRRPTSWGACLARGGRLSGEAEIESLVRASSEGLGVQALTRHLGWKYLVILPADSSADWRSELVRGGRAPAHRVPHPLSARGTQKRASLFAEGRGHRASRRPSDEAPEYDGSFRTARSQVGSSQFGLEPRSPAPGLHSGCPLTMPHAHSQAAQERELARVEIRARLLLVEGGPLFQLSWSMT